MSFHPSAGISEGVSAARPRPASAGVRSCRGDHEFGGPDLVAATASFSVPGGARSLRQAAFPPARRPKSERAPSRPMSPRCQFRRAHALVPNEPGASLSPMQGELWALPLSSVADHARYCSRGTVEVRDPPEYRIHAVTNGVHLGNSGHFQTQLKEHDHEDNATNAGTGRLRRAPDRP